MALPQQQAIESFEHLQDLQSQDVVLTDYLQITQEQILAYAEVSLDRQWIHVDPERAIAESPFKKPIAHGLFLLAMAANFLISGIRMGQVGFGLVTGVDHVRFVSAVPVDSRIRGRIRLMQCERLKDCTQAVWMVTVERQDGIIPSCVAEFTVRYYA